MSTPLGSSLAAAVRVIDRVHRSAADKRSPSQMKLTPRFANHDILMFHISDLPDRSATIEADHPDFSGRKTHMGIVSLAPDDLGRHTGRANQFSAGADFQFEIMNFGTDRNILERQAVAGDDIDGLTRFYRLAHFQPDRCQNV